MFEKRYRLLWGFAKGLHKTQAKTLVAIAVGLIRCGQVRSFALAGQLATSSGIRFKSGLQRFYRWMHHGKLDDLVCWSALAGYLLPAAGRRPIVAVDWTEWHSGLRVLCAAICVGRRAVPVLAQAFSKTDIPRSQNTRENTFLRLLVRLSAGMERAVLVFDRGFRRVSFLRELKWLNQPFIIRLAAKVQAVGEAYQGLLSTYPLRPGQLVDLGSCRLGQRSAVHVRVVGIWAKGQKEPWWLATTLNCPAKRVAEFYDRRMSVEAYFRDSKGCRYGIKMKWTRFQSGQTISRLFLLAALAMVVWYAAALLACRADPSLRLRSKTKGPRRSQIAVGIEATDSITRVLAMTLRRLAPGWPSAEFRTFAWCEK